MCTIVIQFQIILELATLEYWKHLPQKSEHLTHTQSVPLSCASGEHSPKYLKPLYGKVVKILQIKQTSVASFSLHYQELWKSDL